MPESSHDWFYDLTPRQELREFKGTLEQHAVKPPNGDYVIKAAAQAMLYDWKKFRPIISGAFAFRRAEMERPFNPHMLPNLVERAIFRGVEEHDPEGWPAQIDDQGRATEVYDNPERFRKIFPVILPKKNDELSFNDFQSAISFMNVMSNPGQRAAALKMLLVGFGERLPAGASIADFGCSANHWLAAIASDIRLWDVDVVSDIDYPVKDEVASRIFNEKLKQSVEIGPSIGFDQWPWDRDETIREWARICTLIPSEIILSRQLARRHHILDIFGVEVEMTPEKQYRMLDKVKDPRLNFAQMDIAEVDSVERYLGDPDLATPSNVDVVNMGTMLQQQPTPIRSSILANVQRFKHDNSLEAVHDFVRVNPEDPQELIFEDDIYAPGVRYRTVVKDPENPNGWQEIFIWESGRCRRVQLGLGQIMVNGEPRTIAQQLGIEA